MAIERVRSLLNMWKQIPGFSDYDVSSDGDVRRSLTKSYAGTPGNKKKPGGLIKPVVASTGYLIVTIKHDDGKIKYKGIHQLVALAFHGPQPSPKHKAIHWDDCKTNNSYLNIRWGTSRDNGRDMIRNGGIPRGESHYKAKLTDAQLLEMQRLRNQGVSIKQLQEVFGLSYANTSRASRGKLRRRPTF